jgi:hypothetical protein
MSASEFHASIFDLNIAIDLESRFFERDSHLAFRNIHAVPVSDDLLEGRYAFLSQSPSYCRNIAIPSYLEMGLVGSCPLRLLIVPAG